MSFDLLVSLATATLFGLNSNDFVKQLVNGLGARIAPTSEDIIALLPTFVVVRFLVLVVVAVVVFAAKVFIRANANASASMTVCSVTFTSPGSCPRNCNKTLTKPCTANVPRTRIAPSRVNRSNTLFFSCSSFSLIFRLDSFQASIKVGCMAFFNRASSFFFFFTEFSFPTTFVMYPSSHPSSSPSSLTSSLTLSPSFPSS